MDDKKIIFSMVGVSKTIQQNQKQVLKNIYLSFFYGAKIDAFMGGISMDLRGARIHDGSIMDIHTFMGGVELKLPQDIDLQVHSSCFIGGVSNPFPRSHTKDAKRLIIKANCMIGGVDIKS